MRGSLVRIAAAAAVLTAASSVSAQTVAPPFAGTYSATDLGSISGLPTSYGGLAFKAGDPNTILIGGQANKPAGRFYEVPVIRGAGSHITGFGTPVATGFGGNNDGGIAYGPGGVLFYSKYRLTQVGQVKPGANADSKIVDLAPLGVVASPGALAFVPPGFGGAGRLKVCSYSSGNFYDLTFAPDGSGTFDISAADQTATLTGGPEGFIYAPAGSPLFPNATLLVTEYSNGRIAAYDADANGDPVVSTRRDFLTGLNGGEGAAIDPVTGDFLFSTFGSSNRVIQVQGFNPPPPPATVAVTSSLNPSYDGDTVTFTATVASGNGSALDGTVTFQDGGIDIGGCVDLAVTGNPANASCATDALTVGNHTVTARYGGNATNAAGDGSVIQQVLDQPPGGVGPGPGGGLRLWLDASDTTTLFGDGACTQPVAVSGGDVACWKDKSGSGSDVTDVGTANGEPTWLGNQFNGQPALQFSKTEQDTLRHVLGTPWTSEYTEFVVFQQIGTPVAYDSFFSNGTPSTGPYHQITHLGGDFKWFHGSTQLTIEPWSNELKLYAVRGDAGSTEVFADGASRGTSAETGGRTFAQYRINQNRSGDRLNNSKIAEVIVYDRALDDCEMEEVSLYLGLKYGRDFFDLGTGWDFAPVYDNDVSGVATFQNLPCAARTVDTAQSSVVTIDTPANLDPPSDKLLIGHDGASLSSLDISSGPVDHRVARLWRADTNQDAGDDATVRVTFDLSQLSGIDPSDPNDLRLLVWSAGQDPTNPADVPTPLGNAIVTPDDRYVRFENVDFAHGDFFTLGHAAPDGILVQNAAALQYPALGPAIVVAPNLRVAFIDAPATTLDSAKVDISDNYEQGADILEINGATSGTQGSLSWSWDPATGILSITGTGTQSEYESLLRLVTFRNTNGFPSLAQRRVTFSLGSGLRFLDNGHFYEFVPSQFIHWDVARDQAAALSYFGLQGYLATITSPPEQAFIETKVQGNGWIGASDSAVEGDWRWVTGPEAAEDGGAGRLFWRGTGSGSPVNGQYNNWALPAEPNNAGNEDFAHVVGNPALGAGLQDKWNDLPNAIASGSYAPLGYIVEYGGLTGDPQVSLADEALIEIIVPALTLDKTAAATVAAGQPLTYTLTYGNTALATAVNVVLHDTVPAGAIVTDADGGTCSPACDGTTPSGGTQTLTWNLGSLAQGASGSVSPTVTAPLTPGTITNTADLGADNAATVQDTLTVTVTGARLSLDKTGPARVAGGATIAYTLTYENSGDGAADSPEIVDTIPAGAIVTDAGGGDCNPVCDGTTPSDGTQTVTWNSGTTTALPDPLAAGATGTLTLELQAPATADTLVNSATFDADPPAAQVTGTASTHVSVCGPNNARLALGTLSDETSPPTVRSYPALSSYNDTPVDITYTPQNVNGSPSFGPAPYSPGSPWAPTDQGAVAIDGDGESMTVQIDFSEAVYGLKLNVSDLDVGSERIEIRAYNGATQVPNGDFTVQPQTSFVLDEATSSMSYGTRVQTSTATNGGLAFETLGSGNVTSNDTAVFVQLGYLVPVTRVEVDYETPPSGSGGIWITAPYFNLACMTKNFTPGSLLAQVETGSMEIRLDNALGDLQTGVALVDEMPAGLEITGVSTPAACAGAVAATAGGTRLELTGGTLGGTEPNTCTIVVDVQGTTAGTKVNDRSRFTSVTAVDRSQTHASLVVTQPVLSLTKTAAPATVIVDGLVTYTLAYSNLGTDTARNVQLVDPIPAGATFISASGGGTPGGGNVTWNLGDLVVGGSGSVTVTVRAPSAPTTLTNTATIAADVPAVGDTASASVSVFGEPQFTLTLVDAPDPVLDDTDLTYTLTLTNTGTLAASGTTLDLPLPGLPGQTTFVAASGGGTFGGGSVTWNLGSLAVGQPAVLTATFHVEAPLPDGTVIAAAATADATNLPTPPVVANALTTVISKPALQVDLTATPAVVQGGDGITYLVAFSNLGTDVAAATELTLTVPAGTTIQTTSGAGSVAVTGQTVTWTIGNLQAGQSGSHTVTVGVDTGIPDGTTLTASSALTSTTVCSVPPAPTATCSASDDATSTVASTAVFELTKTAPSHVAAGGFVTSQLDFANTGNLDGLNVELSDLLPANTIFVSASGGGVCEDGQTPPGPCSGVTDGTHRVVWDLGTLPVGSGGSVSFTVAVTEPLSDGTPLVNHATLASTDPGGPQPATARATTLVTSFPAFTLTKEAPVQIAAGGLMIYRLAWENVGTDQGTGVALVDQLPAHTTLVSATGGPAVNGNELTWSLGTVAAGAGGSFNVVVAVDSPLPNGTLLVNNASLTSNEAPPVARQAVTRVLSAPLPSLVKTSTPADVVAAGGTINYRLDYRNDGNEDQLNATLTDQLPAGITVVAIVGGGIYDPVARTITWDLGTVAAGTGGSQSFTATVPLDTPDGTLLANSATLEGDDAPAISSVSPLLVSSAPMLEVIKTGPALAAAGSSVSYQVTLTNTGNATATNVVLADQLSAHTTYVSATGAHSHSGGLISWSVGDLSPGAGASYSVIASVAAPLPDGTVLDNTALAGGSNVQPAGDGVTTIVTSAPALAVTKSGPALVQAGGRMAYTLEYRNVGTDRATGVVLTDFLPGDTTFASATGGGVAIGGGTVEWNLGNVEGGTGGTVELVVDVANGLLDGTQLHNQAILESDTVPPVSTEWTTTVTSAPILSVTKTATPAVVAPGSTITYSIEVRNDGNEDALNAELADLIPPGTVYFTSVPPADVLIPPLPANPTFASWNMGTLAAGEVRTYQLTVTVPFGTPDGTQIVNDVTLTGDDSPPVSDQIVVPVSASAALRHAKYTMPAVSDAVPGDTINYVLEYQNVGNDVATGATLVDHVPPSMNVVSTSVPAIWNPGARTLTWDLGTLAAGSGGSIDLVLEVDTADPPLAGVVLTNLSTFDSNETPPLSASWAVRILAPVLTLTKTGSPEPVSAGDLLAYLLEYENVGSATATGLVIEDVLDPSLTFAGQTGGGIYDPGTRTVTWLLPALSPGGSGAVTLLATVASPLPAGSEILNLATIDSNETPSAGVLVLNTVLSAPALTLTKTAMPDPVSPGGILTYTLTLANVGNQDANRVVVNDSLPPETSFVSADNGGVYDPDQHLVSWAFDVVPAGEPPLLLTIVVQVDNTAGEITNTAEVFSFETPLLVVSETTQVVFAEAIPTLGRGGLVILAAMVALLGMALLMRRPN